MWNNSDGSQNALEKLALQQQNLLLLCVFPSKVSWEVLHISYDEIWRNSFKKKQLQNCIQGNHMFPSVSE